MATVFALQGAPWLSAGIHDLAVACCLHLRSSAAGKSTFAAAWPMPAADGRRPLHRLRQLLPPGWSHPVSGFDTVDAIDRESLLADLSAARQSRARTLRHYDMRSRTVGRRSVSSGYDIILLEGAYGPQLLGHLPLSELIYLEESIALRLWRRLRRDVRHRQRSPMYVIRQMLFEMLPGERQFILPLRKQATHVIHDQSELHQVLKTLR